MSASTAMGTLFYQTSDCLELQRPNLSQLKETVHYVH